VPRTNSGLMNIIPAVAAAVPMNFLRSTFPELLGWSFASSDIHPPSFSYRAFLV
jgi:hypothetical protein